MVAPGSLLLQVILADRAHLPMGGDNTPNRRLWCYRHGGNFNRILSKDQILVSCSHMNCCLQNYTTHQFTYYLFQEKFKNPKINEIQQSTSKDMYRTSLNIGNNLLPRHIAFKFEATRIYR